MWSEAKDGKPGLLHGVAVIKGFKVCEHRLMSGSAVAFEGLW